jgi:Leucine-rich repeat (LRR) protein
MSETTETQDIVRKRISDWIEKGCIYKSIDLDMLGLTEIPELPNNIKRLSLHSNKIKHISYLPPSLEVLYIPNNAIEYINTELPENLEHLFVFKNKLRCLPYLPDSLELIDMSYNNISILPNIPCNLEWLYCYDNPVPFELMELDISMRSEFCEESHKGRINLWKKFIKKSFEEH